MKYNNQIITKGSVLEKSSVADPFHFDMDMDMDPDPDPAPNPT